jgi:serine/threonine-protein kinase RsbW
MTTAIRPTNVTFDEGPPLEAGACVVAREIPSDPMLVTPLVLRTLELLRAQETISPGDCNRVGVCLSEAIENAVIHGNQRDFRKKVALRVFVEGTDCRFVVTDQGAGFDWRTMEQSPGKSVDQQSGYGLRVIAHYMDAVAFHDGGRTIVMVKKS